MMTEPAHMLAVMGITAALTVGVFFFACRRLVVLERQLFASLDRGDRQVNAAEERCSSRVEQRAGALGARIDAHLDGHAESSR